MYVYIATIHIYRYYIYLLLLYIIFYTGFAFHFSKPTTLQDSTLCIIYTDGYTLVMMCFEFMYIYILLGIVYTYKEYTIQAF